MALAATWLISVAFAALVLFVVVASYGVLFFAFRKQGSPEGEQE